MISLYNIDEILALRLVELEELIQTQQDERLVQSCIDDIEELHLEREQKLQQCWYVLRSYERTLDAYQAEIKALTESKRVKEAAYERLKTYVARSLGEGNNFAHGTANFGWLRSERVEITDESAVPDAYRRYKWEPAKTEIKNDLKAGADLPFAKLVVKNNLQIK